MTKLATDLVAQAETKTKRVMCVSILLFLIYILSCIAGLIYFAWHPIEIVPVIAMSKDFAAEGRPLVVKLFVKNNSRFKVSNLWVFCDPWSWVDATANLKWGSLKRIRPGSISFDSMKFDLEPQESRYMPQTCAFQMKDLPVRVNMQYDTPLISRVLPMVERYETTVSIRSNHAHFGSSQEDDLVVLELSPGNKR